uniref:Uncharacterized protein n=1 Tax=Siphoviridae sp. ctmpG14 TaxID=2825654 RepID=A0A8S5PC78_9CAUD|nr:MAG TPA: hypothetical protein [Siphoviridae sp. ctmpG14]
MCITHNAPQKRGFLFTSSIPRNLNSDRHNVGTNFIHSPRQQPY